MINWRIVLKGLISALSGGLIAGAATLATGKGEVDWSQVGVVAVIAAATSLGNYLKQSPIVKDEVTNVKS